VDVRTGYAKTPDGAHLAYSVSGAGPVDLLSLTPWMISIDSLDDEPHSAHFYRRIASFARVIRFDFRGVGLSDPVDLSEPPTMQSLGDDALAVLDAVGAEHVVVLAENGGVPIAVELAARRPDRVASLVLCNGYARLTAAADYPIGFPGDLIERFLEQNTDPDVQFDVDGADDLALIAPSLRDDHDFRAWWSRASRRAASPATARILVGMTARADCRRRLADVTVPTLVLHSRHARFVPRAAGAYLAENIAGARFVPVESSDTMAWGDASDAIADEIEEFATGRRSGNVDRALATVLFTDIVDSTGRAAALGDREWRSLLDRHDAAVRAQLARFAGREINTTGDGFLAAFDSPTQAVRAGQAMVAAASASGVAIRVGIHTGECERRGDDLAGLTVHIAARVAAAAAPGDVLVSRTVCDLVAGSGLRFVDRGEHELKGVPERWRLFALEA
jgi:class 3 adenylate cyclase